MNSSFFFDSLYKNDKDRTNIVNSQVDVVFSNNVLLKINYDRHISFHFSLFFFLLVIQSGTATIDLSYFTFARLRTLSPIMNR
jgi:hypothetical protein